MKVLVAVCGSIAAYRSVDFARELKSRGHDVKILLTRGAEEFVSSRVFETFFGERPLSNDVFDPSHAGTDHIRVARWAERIVVYGATAHFLAAYRAGLADDFLQTQLLAFGGEVCVMPAMNPAMWLHPATQDNCRVLEERGVKFWGPVGGKVACGEEGVGHILSHEQAFRLFDEGVAQKKSPLKASGPKVLVSMGPMRSRLDSVRYLQNESSGKMGLELVRALVRAGLVPQVMVGPVEEDVRSQLASLVGAEQVKAFVDDADYARLVADASRACDIFFSAAAVLDFAFENAAVAKLDKTQLDAAFKLRPVEDFAASFGRDKRDGQWLVSFSAEVEDDDRALLERALGKKLAKNAEWTLVNRVSSDSGPNAAASEAWILNPDQGIVYLGESRSKREIADELVSEIQRAWELR